MKTIFFKKNRILENCVFQNMFFLFNNYILQKTLEKDSQVFLKICLVLPWQPEYMWLILISCLILVWLLWNND